MLAQLQLQNFRCFEALAVPLAPGFNYFLGGNGAGKTSILEAACILLRLQSQRSSSLAAVVRFGTSWFGVSGFADGRALQFRYSRLRRKVLLDGAEQSTSDEYLRIGRVVSFANTDIELIRGSSEPRRRYLDFIGAQIEPSYRPTLRAYERALRSRNALLKLGHSATRQLAAYDRPLVEHGAKLARTRSQLVRRIEPFAIQAYREISGNGDSLGLSLLAGNSDDFAGELSRSRTEEMRLRQTLVGPHRDDLVLLVDGNGASQFASEGQQRTVALALKIAQARIFHEEGGAAPLLLIDDIFGELDVTRRRALLRALPPEAQKLVTATSMPWNEAVDGVIFELRDRALTTR